MKVVWVMGGPLLVLFLGCTGKKPLDLGVNHGRLVSCPRSPNCVSTQALDEKHRIDPIRYSGSLEAVRNRMLDVLRSMPRTRIVEATDEYIHAECRTRVFGFVDDVEFYFNDRLKTIQFRSASRVGHSDFGMNRKRMEQIRQLFEAR